MSVDLQWFDAETTEEMGFEAIPAGDYLAMIVESEMKTTKDGNGEYLQLKIEVVEEGEFKGRNLWERLNVKNANETAVKIAMSTLKSVCRAVGNMAPRTSGELHDVPFVVRVKVGKRKDTGDPNNEIKGYFSRAEAAAAKQQQATPRVAAGSTPPVQSAAPWAPRSKATA